MQPLYYHLSLVSPSYCTMKGMKDEQMQLLVIKYGTKTNGYTVYSFILLLQTRP